MLHVTNGDSTVASIAASGLGGTTLPWRDVLHDGPIPAGLPLDELREVRARFIADRGWGSYERVLAEFTVRDETLAAFRDHQEVVLWFEHDLYDQLQLIQILDWFAGQSLGASRLSLICISAFPGVNPFYGLGTLNADQITTLYPHRVPVSPDQLALAQLAWAAVRSPDPTAIETVIAGDTRSLPFLGAALKRYLEEFPGLRDGLSRTERQALEALVSGPSAPYALFQAAANREEYPFLGDSIFWTHLHGLATGPVPVISPFDGRPFLLPNDGEDPAHFARRALALTDAGEAVVAGHADYVALNGIDRWLGGVHLIGQSVPWRWDDAIARGSLHRVA